MGISNPSKAIEGTACTKFTNPIIGFLKNLTLETRIPKGTPINIAIPIAVIVKYICRTNKSNI